MPGVAKLTSCGDALACCVGRRHAGRLPVMSTLTASAYTLAGTLEGGRAGHVE